jgi:acylphosphatase
MQENERVGEGGQTLVRRRVVVDGRVQGVFFRDSCQEEARAAGVAGWVRNRDDGRVEVVVEGEPAAVDRLVTWCREGPSSAHITGIEVTEEEPEGVSGFGVR